MAGFELNMWNAGSDVDSDSASGAGGPGQGSSPTRMTSEGTFEGGVVVRSQSQLFVNTTPDQIDCRLVRLHGSAIDGNDLCGGDIGRAGRVMCVAKSAECSVVSHKQRPTAPWKLVVPSPSGVYVFISVAGTQTKVWTDSAIAFETIEPVWVRVKDEERTMPDWMALFNKIKSGGLPQEELVRIVDTHADSDEALGRTSASPRHLNADEESAVNWDTLQGGEEAFTNAEEDEAGARVAGDVRDRLHQLGRAVVVTRSQQREAELRHVQLQNQVGIRTPKDGTASVHKAMTRVEDRLDNVEVTTEAVQDQMATWNRAGDLKWIQNLRREDGNLGRLRTDLAKEVSGMMTRNVGPIIGFFNSHTTKDVGDGLNRVLRSLGERLSCLESGKGSAGRERSQDRFGQPAAAGSEEGFALNLFAAPAMVRPSAGTARPSAVEDSDAARRLLAMEEKCAMILQHYTRLSSQVQNLQEENRESNVEIAGVIFYSMPDFVARFTDEAQGPEEQVGFSDIVALLVSTGPGRDLMEVGTKLKEQTESIKAGFNSAEGAYYAESFSCYCPDQFRKQSDRDGIDMNRRLLTRFPKFDKFDTRTSGASAKSVILSKVQHRAKQLIAAHRPLRSRRLFEMKKEMIEGAVRFLDQLFTWMSIHYRDQVAEQGEEAESEIWLYIQHSVRDIFQALYEVRHFGVDRAPAEQAWYALRGHALQEQIMAAEFTNHDIVLKVLHQHLKNNVVTKTQFEKEITALKALVLKDARKGKDKTK